MFRTRRRPGPSPDPSLPLRNDGPVAARIARTHAPLPAAGDPAPLAAEESELVISAFGNAVRRGSWEPPARLRVFALFGGASIDYCEADMLEGESVLEITVICGGVTVRVPEDIDVVTEGVGIFGGFGHKQQRAAPESDPPRLRIVGLALFGGVEIKGPRKKRLFGRKRR